MHFFFLMAFACCKPQICRWVTQALPALFLCDWAARAEKKPTAQERLWPANSWHCTRYTFGTCGWASTLWVEQTEGAHLALSPQPWTGNGKYSAICSCGVLRERRRC